VADRANVEGDREGANVPGDREGWSARERVIRGVVGGALIAWGSRHRGAFGAIADVAGGTMLLRSATNRSVLQMAREYRRRSHEAQIALAEHAERVTPGELATSVADALANRNAL
jgi:uncharacterized membrane protein